jgi:hypothetical protein
VIIDADVRTIAAEFNLDPALVQAVVRAEGDIVRAVQCSFPSVTTREDALRVLCRSAVHAMRDYIANQRLQQGFVEFWGARWAPQGAANDPRHLNANWAHNVYALWIGTSVASS